MAEEVRLPSIPKVKIIKDGKEVDTSAIDDYDPFMTFIMQAAQTANIVKIRKHFDDRTSIGETENFDLNITPEPQEVEPYYPAQSLSLVNRVTSAGKIFVAINALNRTATPLEPGEPFKINFETHTLRRFYVWSEPGTVATAWAVVKF